MIFTRDVVLDRLRNQPFRPARIVTTTGQTYDIFHPDMIWVGGTFVMVGLPATADPATLDRTTRIALAHITELQDLSSAAPPATANGQQAGP